MLRLVAGNDNIKLVGNRRRLPYAVRRIFDKYFHRGNRMYRFMDFPSFYKELLATEAYRYLNHADVEVANRLFQKNREKHEVVFCAKRSNSAPVFFIRQANAELGRPLVRIIKRYCKDGQMQNPFDIWIVDKILRRLDGIIYHDKSFAEGYAEFSANAVGVYASITFRSQIQLFHSEVDIGPQAKSVLKEYCNDYQVLRELKDYESCIAELQHLKANIYIDESIQPILRQHRQVEELYGRFTQATPNKYFTGQLYDYQARAVALMVAHRKLLIADDMGIGKTIQSIAALSELFTTGSIKQALVICPAALKEQWAAEFARFSQLSVTVVAGSQATRKQLYASARETQVLILNYELLLNDIDDILRLGYDALVVDEAHRLKNRSSQTYKATCRLKAEYLYFLTGTPLENDLDNLYNLLKILDPEIIDLNYYDFSRKYFAEEDARRINPDYAAELKLKVKSATLRRTRDILLDHLPELASHDEWLTMEAEQAELYAHWKEKLKRAFYAGGQLAEKNIFTYLLRLLEICDHPQLLDAAGVASVKLEHLSGLLESTRDQVVVFTRWSRMAELLHDHCQYLGLSAALMTGQVPAASRHGIVSGFHRGDNQILISTDAGNYGVNLQCASVIINYDIPFNPAIVSQRISRLHRIGQKHDVRAVNLLVGGTVEERVAAINQQKRTLFGDLFDLSKSDFSVSTTTSSVRELVREVADL